MLPCIEVLTPPLIHKEDYMPYTSFGLLRASLLLLQVDRDHDLDQNRLGGQNKVGHGMEQRRDQSKDGRGTDDIELWLSTSSSLWERRLPSNQQSAYQATSEGFTRYQQLSSLPDAGRSIPVPTLSYPSGATMSSTSPRQSPEGKKKRKSTSFRSLIGRRPSEQHESIDSFLHPSSTATSQKATQTRSLSPYQGYPAPISDSTLAVTAITPSRSMPSTPNQYQAYQPFQPPPQPSRAASAHVPPSFTSPISPVSSQAYPQYRSASISSPVVSPNSPPSTQYPLAAYPFPPPGPPRARRTFPESGRESTDRPRPQSWRNPEPFDDASEFRLFVEATSGLPTDVGLGWDGGSPMSPPRLQPSLFGGSSGAGWGSSSEIGPMPGWNPDWGRGRTQDRLNAPLPPVPRTQSPASMSTTTAAAGMGFSRPAQPRHTHSQQQLQVYTQSTPRSQTPQRTPIPNSVILELERLGVEDDEERPGEDELPDYAQSQAEMSELRRREAASRARELEERWARSRGR